MGTSRKAGRVTACLARTGVIAIAGVVLLVGCGNDRGSTATAPNPSGEEASTPQSNASVRTPDSDTSRRPSHESRDLESPTAVDEVRALERFGQMAETADRDLDDAGLTEYSTHRTGLSYLGWYGGYYRYDIGGDLWLLGTDIDGSTNEYWIDLYSDGWWDAHYMRVAGLWMRFDVN